VTFQNRDGGARQAILRVCKVGQRVTLRREWGNEHDLNAIMVRTEEGQIGYVPAEIAAKLVVIGFDAEATITEMRGGTPGAPTLGCEITINAGGKESHGNERANQPAGAVW
jgi:hypothetical protein